MMRIAWGLVFLSLATSESHAQVGFVTMVETGIRASGMGRAATALWWGDNPDTWANPSLLGYQQGIRYLNGRTELVPDVSKEVVFRSDGVAVGSYGLGFYFSGKPIDGLGRARLDYGTFHGQGPSGEDLTYSRFDEVNSWSLGANLLETTDNIVRLLSKKPSNLSRFGDVSLGMAHKHVDIFLFPDLFGFPPGAGQAEFDAKDEGILIRLTPYNGLDHPDYLASVEKKVRARFDAAFGASTINEDDPLAVFGAVGSVPVWKDSRKALSLRLALHPTANYEARMAQGPWGWLTHLWMPALSLAATWDRSVYGPAITDTSGTSYDETNHRYGLEVALLNMVGFRVGHVKDPVATIDGTTWGFDVGVNYEHCAGARFEWASFPQGTFSSGAPREDVHRSGFMAFIEPVHLWKVLH